MFVAFLLELTSQVTRIASSREAAVKMGSEYVVWRTSVLLEPMFQGTCILVPDYRFVWTYRVIDIHSSVKWRNLLRAVAKAENIHKKVLSRAVQQHLIMVGLSSETWRVFGPQQLSIFVYQLTVDALPFIFPDGLQVKVHLQTPILFLPYRLPILMVNFNGCIEANGVFTVWKRRKAWKHSYLSVRRYDRSESWHWMKTKDCVINLHRSLATGGHVFLLRQVGLKRFLSFGRQLTWPNLINAIAETEGQPVDELRVRIQCHLYTRGLCAQVWRVHSPDMLEPSQLQHTVEALPLIFPRGIFLNVEMLPRLLFAPGQHPSLLAGTGETQLFDAILFVDSIDGVSYLRMERCVERLRIDIQSLIADRRITPRVML